MSLLIDAVRRTLDFAVGREPRYSAPPPRRRANSRGDTNSDDSIGWLRQWNTPGGPARVVPLAGAGEGARPTPSSAGRGRMGAQPHLDWSVGGDRGAVQQVGFSQGLPYGVVSSDGRGDVAAAQQAPDGRRSAAGDGAAGWQSGSDGRVRK